MPSSSGWLRSTGSNESSRLELASLTAVEEKDEEDRDAVDDTPAPVRHVLGEEHADESDERDRAGDRPEVVTPAAEDRDAADHARGDRLEEVRVAHAERRLAAVADEDDAREGGEEPAQHVESDRHDPDADPRE